MSLNGISNQSLSSIFASTKAQSASLSTASSTSGTSGAEDDFLKFMQLTPEQQMLENWLKSHGITKEQFEAMSPDEKQSLMAQMKQELQEKIKQAVENPKPNQKPGSLINVLA